ncbi:hypothetical protein DPC56_01230 [Methanothermobacter tenebrarum]|uniref:Uncharacterized protein n=1 Tax=Methanothermobacter tenebrarum TaxID=680118 RepID=A0A328PB01_9EURY|nr:hypothetical protein DPC56_01230 [Methanothermobacter tenebrarum]
MENHPNISKKLSRKGREVTVLSTGNNLKETYDNFKLIRIKNKLSISNTPLNMFLPLKRLLNVYRATITVLEQKLYTFKGWKSLLSQK